MDREVKEALSRLQAELRKDLPFFGFCGLIVGLFLVWQAKATERGWSKAHWASDLLSDFMSFNAFGLVFFVYLAIGCTITVLSRFNVNLRFLASSLDHMEERLTQFASSLLAFMVGLLVFVILASLLNLDSGGLKVLLLSSLFSGLIGFTYIAGTLVARRAEPFDLWWVALIMLAACIGVLGWLVFIANGKTSH
ncbi:hypothetical protein [Xanthomonas bundabergensis]|uniref:hypothetical protein n=1 Tax=Xanthomonas bundabergensis TaxID=3160842 RepID=UPI0035185CE4